LLNEFFLYVLEDLHTGQSLGALKFTSDDPAFVGEAVDKVYPAIPATPTAAGKPATKAFSRELISYFAAFLPVAPYYKATDTRIATLCDDQYTATLETLSQTDDEKFSAYLIRKTQGWFRRWGIPRTSSDAPGTPAAGGVGAGVTAAVTPARRPGLVASDDDESSGLVGQGPMSQTSSQAGSSSPILALETLPSPAAAVGRA
jgi:hypothetical protein